jgi:GTP-binding protein EngB required for normal cell division
MSLRDYEHHKFAIAEILRAASNIAPTEDYALRERLRDLFARLAEDRFNLVVVGRFNRGKTSIMNSILGSDRLPVGVIPLTSVITTVSYGTTEQVVLRFNRSNLTTDIPIDALPQYVTQEGNPGNVRGIKIAEVKLRAEVLRRGFYFVDTPGLGSAIAENTRTTEAFLPEADAFLLVTSYESPLTEEEIRFLQSVLPSARRIFVILNKHDTVTFEQREKLVGFVRDQLQGIFGQAAPRLFSVSANEGLSAKQLEDIPRLSASGIPALEEALVGFLLSEKRDQFLQQMCRRSANVIRTLSPSSEAMDLARQIGTLLERLTYTDRSNVAPEGTAPTQAGPPSLQQLNPCEICSHVNDALWDFECQYQYQISVDHQAQRDLVATGGLCSFHTWQYHTIASPYGICTAYPKLLDHLAGWLRTAAFNLLQNEVPATLALPTAISKHCVLCDLRARAESEAISRLALRFSKQGVQTLNSLSAICMPHMVILTRALENSDHVRMLMKHQAALLERVSEDMRRYTLKHDAARRFLETKEEAIAAERALLLIAGHRNVTASSSNRATDHSTNSNNGDASGSHAGKVMHALWSTTE